MTKTTQIPTATTHLALKNCAELKKATRSSKIDGTKRYLSKPRKKKYNLRGATENTLEIVMTTVEQYIKIKNFGGSNLTKAVCR